MASIRKEVLIGAGPDEVWDAVRDFGAVHRRLAPGFVIDTRLDGDARLVTFANGTVVREVLVGIDDAARRLVWTIVGWRATHHNGAMQVYAEDGGRSRLVWITDLLPDALAPGVAEIMDAALATVKRTFARRP